MTLNTQIPRGDWSDFLTTFTNGNRGRSLTIELLDPETGSSGQARQGPLMAVDFDTPGKGNAIVITTGVHEMDYSHAVHNPVELWKAQHDNGEVLALEIIDGEGTKTVLSLA
jgi:hypothetical protein